jgi:hypothetical protein
MYSGSSQGGYGKSNKSKNKWWKFGRGNKDGTEGPTLEEMGKNYRAFMRMLPDNLNGKEEAQEFVEALEHERETANSNNQRFVRFRSQVQSTLTVLLVPKKNKIERRDDEDDEEWRERKDQIEKMERMERNRSPEDLFEKFLDAFEDMRKERDHLRDQLEESRQEKSKINRELRSERELLQTIRGSHHDEVKNIERKHNREKDEMRDKHREQMEQEKFDRATEKAQLNSKYDTKVSDMTVEYQTLQKHFIEGSDVFQPKPDADFNRELIDLKAKVQSLAQKDKDTRVQSIGKLNTGEVFLDAKGRKVREKIFVLEKAIWNILNANLFATPFQVFGKYGEEMLNTMWRDACADRKFDLWGSFKSFS